MSSVALSMQRQYQRLRKQFYPMICEFDSFRRRRICVIFLKISCSPLHPPLSIRGRLERGQGSRPTPILRQPPRHQPRNVKVQRSPPRAQLSGLPHSTLALLRLINQLRSRPCSQIEAVASTARVLLPASSLLLL